MFISRLKLTNWKNFKNVDIHLQERAFLLGANATGKSNLLDVLRFMRDIAKGKGGGLQQAIDDRGGISKIRCYAARTVSYIEIHVEFSDHGVERPLYIYQLALTQETSGRRRPIIKSEKVTVDGKVVLDRPQSADNEDAARLTETHLEQTTANKSFRPIAEFFNAVCYLHIVPQMIRTSDGRSYSLSDDPFGKSFLERIAKTPLKTRTSRLKKIEDALTVISPQLSELSFEPDEKGQPHLTVHRDHWRPHAGKQNETFFSDGTLRAIGLLWMLQESTTALLIEEPELSLNSEIVKQLPVLFSRVARKHKRQLFISTHSRELLDNSSIAPEEIILLNPDEEATTVSMLSENTIACDMYKAGLTVADLALPKVMPLNAEQLSHNFDK